MQCLLKFPAVAALALVFLPCLLNNFSACVLGKAAVVASGAAAPSGGKVGVAAKKSVDSAKLLEGWRLAQRTKLDARTEVLLVHDAVKIKVLKSGLVIVGCKPWKQVSYYSTMTGKVCTVPFDKAVYPYLTAIHLTSGGDLSNLDLVPTGRKTFAGVDCNVYIESEKTRKQISNYVSHREMAGMAPVKVEYLVSSQFNVSPEAGRLIAQYCSLPRLNGVPISFTAKTYNGGSRTELTTYSCERAKISPTDFEVPGGLKFTGSTANVLVSDDDDKETLELMMPSKTGR